MKSLYLITLFLIFLLACEKQEEIVPVEEIKDPVYEMLSEIKFKLIPLSDHELQINWIYPDTLSFQSVWLFQEEDTIGKFNLTESNIGSIDQANISYQFKPGQTYHFHLQAPASDSLIYYYQINNYQHIFKNDFFSVEKIMEFDHALEIDISPSRNFMFVYDYINNDFFLKKYDLNLDQMTVYPGDSIPGQFFRAISDQEILIQSHEFQGRYPTKDSIAIQRYHLDQDTARFLAWGSDGYGRYSRVVDHQILITNPVFSSRTSSVIDLEYDTIVRSYLNTTIDFRYIREYNYDHIYYKNFIIDVPTGKFLTPLNLPSTAYVSLMDPNQYGIVVNSKNHENQPYQNKFLVYQNKSILFESEFDQDRSFLFGSLSQVRNNQYLFYQSFDYSEEINLDGFYLLDLEQQEVQLIQTTALDFYDYFEIDQNQLIAFSHRDGMYRLNKIQN
ncbi:MAG: hypothetical protein ACNS62_13080 [Candidatus Cyclobacteriaceae bacterium M3_2C_046]